MFHQQKTAFPKCEYCDKNADQIKLDIALRLFKYFNKECNMLRIVAAHKVEEISGISNIVIQEAMDIIYKDEILQEMRKNEKSDLEMLPDSASSPSLEKSGQQSQSSSNIINKPLGQDEPSKRKTGLRILDPDNININFEIGNFSPNITTSKKNNKHKPSNNGSEKFDSRLKNTSLVTFVPETNISNDIDGIISSNVIPIVDNEARTRYIVAEIRSEDDISSSDSNNLTGLNKQFLIPSQTTINVEKNVMQKTVIGKDKMFPTQKDGSKMPIILSVQGGYQKDDEVNNSNGLKDIQIVGVDMMPLMSNNFNTPTSFNIATTLPEISFSEIKQTKSDDNSEIQEPLFPGIDEPPEKWKNLTLTYPMNNFPATSLLARSGEFLISEIRQVILKYYIVNLKAPILDELLNRLRESNQILRRSSKHEFVNLLKECVGFYLYKPRHMLNFIVLERKRVYEWRSEYLLQLKKFRIQGLPIYYTSIKFGFTKSLLWKNSWTSLITNKPTGDETNPITIALLQFASEKHGVISEFTERIIIQHNNTLNNENGLINNPEYEKWFKNVTDSTPDNAIIIVGDYSPLHSKWHLAVPDNSWKTDDIEAWLLEKVPNLFDVEGFLNLEKILENVKERNNADRILNNCSRKILHLPPHHHELNPIEYQFEDVKKTINQSLNSDYDIHNIINQFFSKFDESKWNSVLKQVKLLEKTYLCATNLLTSNQLQNNSCNKNSVSEINPKFCHNKNMKYRTILPKDKSVTQSSGLVGTASKAATLVIPSGISIKSIKGDFLSGDSVSTKKKPTIPTAILKSSTVVHPTEISSNYVKAKEESITGNTLNVKSHDKPLSTTIELSKIESLDSIIALFSPLETTTNQETTVITTASSSMTSTTSTQSTIGKSIISPADLANISSNQDILILTKTNNSFMNEYLKSVVIKNKERDTPKVPSNSNRKTFCGQKTICNKINHNENKTSTKSSKEEKSSLLTTLSDEVSSKSGDVIELSDDDLDLDVIQINENQYEKKRKISKAMDEQNKRNKI